MPDANDAFEKLKSQAAALSGAADTATSLPLTALSPEAAERMARLNLALEKRKQNFELVKWFIGSVVLVIMTAAINWNLKDREDSLKEVQEYNKYATDLIILNNDPVKRRMLAQFFAKVIPTDKVRGGWQAYYELVEPEYKEFLTNTKTAQKQYAILAAKPDPTEQERAKKDSLANYIQRNQALIKEAIVAPIILSAPSASKQLSAIVRPAAAATKTRNPTMAAQWESAGFNYLLQRDVANAIVAFDNAEAAYPTYHQVFEIANLLRQRQATLSDSKAQDWKSVYAIIVNKMSWQMPAAAKKKLLDIIQPSLPDIPKGGITSVPSAILPTSSNVEPARQPEYGPVELSIAIGYSRRWGYYDDARRLINVALDKTDVTEKSATIRVSTENKRFKRAGNEPTYTIRQGTPQDLSFYGFPYKLKLVKLSEASASLSLERYQK